MGYQTFCERFMAATQADDGAMLGTMLHPDFLVEEAAGLPYGGTYRGLDGWRTLSKAVTSTWSKFRIKPIAYPGESETHCTVRFAISGVSRKTGRAFATTVLELWEFADGRLLRIDPYYFDTHALAMADAA